MAGGSEPDDEDLRSRTDLRLARKQSEEELMQLGKDLVSLGGRLLEKLELPDEVVQVVLDARRVETHAARSRALRLVRTALRGVDTAALQNKLRTLVDPSRAPRKAPDAAPDAADRWRERLMSGGDEALAEFVEAFPTADRQRLRHLVRNARKAGSGPRSLMKALRELVE